MRSVAYVRPVRRDASELFGAAMDGNPYTALFPMTEAPQNSIAQFPPSKPRPRSAPRSPLMSMIWEAVRGVQRDLQKRKNAWEKLTRGASLSAVLVREVAGLFLAVPYGWHAFSVYSSLPKITLSTDGDWVPFGSRLAPDATLAPDDAILPPGSSRRSPPDALRGLPVIGDKCRAPHLPLSRPFCHKVLAASMLSHHADSSSMTQQF